MGKQKRGQLGIRIRFTLMGPIFFHFRRGIRIRVIDEGGVSGRSGAGVGSEGGCGCEIVVGHKTNKAWE